jgi:hypothetical protein
MSKIMSCRLNEKDLQNLEIIKDSLRKETALEEITNSFVLTMALSKLAQKILEK